MRSGSALTPGTEKSGTFLDKASGHPWQSSFFLEDGLDTNEMHMYDCLKAQPFVGYASTPLKHQLTQDSAVQDFSAVPATVPGYSFHLQAFRKPVKPANLALEACSICQNMIGMPGHTKPHSTMARWRCLYWISLWPSGFTLIIWHFLTALFLLELSRLQDLHSSLILLGSKLARQALQIAVSNTSLHCCPQPSLPSPSMPLHTQRSTFRSLLKG
jgi:hypothetical protein